MSDDASDNDKAHAFVRQRLTQRAKECGWVQSLPSSDFLTWVVQRMLGCTPDGLLGPTTSAAALDYFKKQQAPTPSMATLADAFTRHLDECEQCRDHPFDLCENGKVLLQVSTMLSQRLQKPPSSAAPARAVPGIHPSTCMCPMCD